MTDTLTAPDTTVATPLVDTERVVRGVTGDDDPAAILAAAPRFPGVDLLGLLSHGTDLDTFDVWDRTRRTRAVLKTVRDDRVDDPDVADRLRHEAELLLRLCHPHIVRAYTWDAHPRPFLLEEAITGHTLGALLERSGRLRTAELLHLADHLSAALAYLHDEGVLHLDLKPSNIVAECGRAKLIDFSLAHAPGNGPAGWGTRRYLAPEQVTGGAFTAATDVWGLGVVLTEAALGTCPLAELPSSAGRRPTLDERLAGRPTLASRRRLPAAFRAVVGRCLAADPHDRPTLEEVRTVVTAFTGC